ncbi:GPP34 family phosphoprotein [Streptomyces bambusae]|uniref:GOLPH3/VPS74 family protein n=1 Tax=Streptomyces bambusae TaxID=1550616 RepID=UPI001CFC5AE2|nr:GPP34 family phosphoprotein [Streptomyces bambusae]MCB5163801.1 GPP34 family phosphoprotein [Streptomyces bambusae]
MTITLAEEIMLLSLDDETGSAKRRQAAGWAVSGAILLELLLAGRLSITGNHFTITDPTPTGNALLDGRLATIGQWMRGRDRRRVAEWLVKDQPKAVSAAIESLCERGVVAEQTTKALGLFPIRRYPEADGTPERELRARLHAVVLNGAVPDTRTTGLIAILHATKLHRLAFPHTETDHVTVRMQEIATTHSATTAPLQSAIRDMRAAILAANVITLAAVVS